MHSDVPLDYAIFQLSPRRSRCELFVSYDDATEKLASGLVKPFITHLKAAEEQVALGGRSIKLDVERYENAEPWFTKGTLERFVRFVSTPEVLEVVNTFDAEMSQLEAAQKIYSQGASDAESGTSGGNRNGATVASDATKKELLRAIDVRLSAVKQDLTTACCRATAAGFNPETVSGLQVFADHFGAHRLSEACSKFITLTQRRSGLFISKNSTTPTWKASDNTLRSSACSDMSLDDPFDNRPNSSTCTSPKVALPLQRFSRDPSPTTIDDVDERESIKDKDIEKDKAMGSTAKPLLIRRLSVQERINMFENQAQISPSTNTTTTTTPTSTSGKPELQRLSTFASSTDKTVLRRWSGASDMSIDVSVERKESDSNANTPTPSVSSSLPLFPPKFKDPSDSKSEEPGKESKLPVKAEFSSQSGLEDPVSSKSNSRIPSFTGRSSEKDFRFENQSTSCQTQIESRPGKVQKFCSPIQCQTEEKLEGRASTSQEETSNSFGTFVTEFESEASDDLVTPKVHLHPVVQNIRVEIDRMPSQPRWQSVAEIEKAAGKVFESSENQTESHSLKMATSGLFGGNRGYGSGSDQVTRRGVRKYGGLSPKVGDGQMGLTGKNTFKNQEPLFSTSSVPIDQVQRVKQVKGNQGVNDDLKKKANELEKLFAEHKLRVPVDQSNSAWRIRPAELAMKVCEPDKDFSGVEKFDSTPLSKTADNHDNDVTPKHNIYSLSFPDDSRGKQYQKYMQKRDAKLREDWSSNRLEKEAKMKAMHDSLEKSRAQIKVKLSKFSEKRNFSSSKSAQGKRVQPNKNKPSPETCNSTTPIPRSSGKASNSSAWRRRLPHDNPMAQSVPNFSDLRKENTRPSSGGSKPVLVQGRNHARKKSTTEALRVVSEEKSRRFQSLRKSMATTMELNDSRNSDDVDDGQFLPSKYHRDEDEDYDKISDMSISKAFAMGEAAKNGHDFGDTNFLKEGMMDVAEDEEYDYETKVVEGYTYFDNNKGKSSHGADKSGNSGYENNASDLPISVPSLFRSLGSTLDSPGESPRSWNLRLQNPFSFSHEISDIIDASDSPTGSHASWNFQTVCQSEAEAVRMRRKWGETQKPIIGIDTSHSQSRKDVTRGIKRFLKFGRKNRASESMADWISVTTSEGDDSEDGRDLPNCSSEDLRKSRMGFSQSHYSDEGFNGSELFNEQVQALRSSIPTPPTNFKLSQEHLSGTSLKAPKSFFSLPNFRSKGNDSKIR